MTDVLVTGGAGFIGSHVAATLVARGYSVTVLDDLSGGFVDNVPAGASFVRGSVADATAVDRLFAAERFAYVFHLAAYAAEGLSHFIKHFNYTNNLLGSINLINASVNHGVRRFVFTSSIAVYGKCGDGALGEDLEPRPEDPYGIAKLAVEQELRVSHDMFGLEYVVFRPHNVYGELQNIGDRYRNVVGIFMNQAMTGRPMTVFGDGTQLRAFSYVGDVAPIIADGTEVPAARNQVFNVGADQPTSVVELAGLVAHAMGVAPQVEHLPARHEVHVAYASHDKVRRAFGDRPVTPLDEGIQRMAAWARRHGPRTSAPFEHIEIRKNLPSAWADTTRV